MNETSPPPGPPGGPGTPGGAPGDAPNSAGALDRFFGWLRGIGITRSGDRWFAGVAGGIAAKAKIDPLIVRGVFVVLAVLGGPGILLYLAGWLLLPDSTGRIHLEEVLRGRASAGVIVTAVILGLLVLLPIVFGALPGLFAGPFSWNAWGFLPDWLTLTLGIIWWALIVPGLVVWFIIWASSGGMNRVGPRPPGSPGATGNHAHGAASQAHSGTASFAAGPSGAAEGMPAEAFDAQGTAGSPTRSPQTATAESAKNWGESFDQRTEAWNQRIEQSSQQWEQWAEEHHYRYGLDAAHVLITLAAALLAAGGAAAWAISSGFGDAAISSSLIAAVAVLGVSLIVAGVRGRGTGWVGFLAFIGVIALLFAPFSTVMPDRTEVVPFGNANLRVSESGADQGLITIAGNTTIDLSNLDNRSEPRTIDLWMLAGNVKVVLPSDHPTRVQVNLLAGNVRDQSLNPADRRQGGIFMSRVIESGVSERGIATATQVNVRLLGGEVSVEGGDSRITIDTRLLSEDQRRAAAEQLERQQEIEELRERLEELENSR